MKKALLVIFIIVGILFFSDALIAKAAQPTLEPTANKEQSQIDELKTRIASKVAQLKLVEKKGIIGTVTDTSDTQITLNDLDGNTRFVDVDEITKFSSSSIKTYGISDVTKGTTLGILGLYNKQSKRILAREVKVTTVPKFIYGTISSVNKQEFTINIVADNNKEITASIENITKTFSYTSDNLVKSGFSKLEQGQNIAIAGYLSKQDKNTILASRIIVFPDIAIKAKKTTSPTPKVNETVVPSTGSGKKLTPITK